MLKMKFKVASHSGSEETTNLNLQEVMPVAKDGEHQRSGQNISINVKKGHAFFNFKSGKVLNVTVSE